LFLNPIAANSPHLALEPNQQKINLDADYNKCTHDLLMLLSCMCFGEGKIDSAKITHTARLFSLFQTVRLIFRTFQRVWRKKTENHTPRDGFFLKENHTKK